MLYLPIYFNMIINNFQNLYFIILIYNKMKITNADKNCAFEMEKQNFSMTQVKITVEKKVQ